MVIPVWNSPDLIAKCLTAMAAQTYPRDRHEVLVVDNGSTDETATVVRTFPFATLLSEPIASAYRARNLGLKSARGEYVAFTDADCIPDPEWLTAAAHAVRQHPHAAVLAGHINLFRADATGNVACEKYECAFAFDQARNASNGVCVTANWLSPRRMLLDFGGYDERLNSGGDWSLCRRIRAAGQSIVYVPDMIVLHPLRSSLAKLAAKRRRTIGGYWTSTSRRWRFLWCSAVLARRTILRTIGTASNKHLTFVDRLRVIWIVMVLSVIGMSELVRLACGGEARRT